MTYIFTGVVLSVLLLLYPGIEAQGFRRSKRTDDQDTGSGTETGTRVVPEPQIKVNNVTDTRNSTDIQGHDNPENDTQHTGVRQLKPSSDLEGEQDDSEVDKATETHIRVEMKDDIANLSVLDTATTETGSCPTCGKRERTGENKEFRVEFVKQQLLQKLGMTAPPKINNSIPQIPFDFFIRENFSGEEGYLQDEEDSPKNTHIKPREIFVFGNDVTHQCIQHRSTGCYSFDLDDKDIDPEEVASIELWIYKQEDLNDHYIQTFMVSELESTGSGTEKHLRRRNTVKRMETKLKYGWMKFYVRRTVIRWLYKPRRNEGLAVTCKTCNRRSHKVLFGFKDGHKPILVFYMRERSSNRVRRETQCLEGAGNCCRREYLEINFSEIGWDWVIAPAVLRPYYCTGSCNGIQAAHYNHTRLLQGVRASSNHVTSHMWKPCCSPTSWRHPQSLMYLDTNGDVKKVDIPDMIVGSCGCT